MAPDIVSRHGTETPETCSPHFSSSSFACRLDADPSFVDKALDVLTGPPEQAAFDNERAAADCFRTAFPEVDAAYWLVSCIRLAVGARPAFRAVTRPCLKPQQKRLLPEIEARLRIGLNLQTGNVPTIVDQQGQDRRMTRHHGAVPADRRVVTKTDRPRPTRLGGTITPVRPARQSMLRIGCAG